MQRRVRVDQCASAVGAVEMADPSPYVVVAVL